jgi:hypothetical protein
MISVWVPEIQIPVPAIEDGRDSTHPAVTHTMQGAAGLVFARARV